MPNRDFFVSEREARLLSLSVRMAKPGEAADDGRDTAESTNEKVLKAGSVKTEGSKLQQIQQQFAQEKYEAAKRLKGADSSTWLGRRFNYTNDYNLSKEINKLATERAQNASKNVRELQNGTDNKIIKAAEDDEDSLVVLEQKVSLCDEVISHLNEEIEARSEEGAAYREGLRLIKGLGGKDLDSKELKDLKTTRERIIAKRNKAAGKAEAARNKPALKKVQEMHTTLVQLLRTSSPDVANLERMILDNVGHGSLTKNSDLVNHIYTEEKEGRITKSQREILVGLAKGLRLKFRLASGAGEHNSSVRSFYTSIMNKAMDVQRKTIDEQMDHLYGAETPGKAIVIHGTGIFGQTRFSLIKQEEAQVEDGKTKKVIRLKSESGFDAVLDPVAKKLTMRVGPKFVHMDVQPYAMQGGDDATALHFAGKARATDKPLSERKEERRVDPSDTLRIAA